MNEFMFPRAKNPKDNMTWGRNVGVHVSTGEGSSSRPVHLAGWPFHVDRETPS